MNEDRNKRQIIHPPVSEWIILLLIGLLVGAAGVMAGARDPGASAVYAPVFAYDDGVIIIEGGRALININAAGQELLEQLPGIGPVRAAAILSYRDEHGAFGSLEEIDRVEGIGIKIIQGLEGFAVCDAP